MVTILSHSLYCDHGVIGYRILRGDNYIAPIRQRIDSDDEHFFCPPRLNRHVRIARHERKFRRPSPKVIAHLLPREFHQRVGDRVTISNGEAILDITIAHDIEHMAIRLEERREGSITCHNDRTRVCGIPIDPGYEMISYGRLGRQCNRVTIRYRVLEIHHGTTAIHQRVNGYDVCPSGPLRLNPHVRIADQHREGRRPSREEVTLPHKRSVHLQHRFVYSVAECDRDRIQRDILRHHIKHVSVRFENSVKGSVALHQHSTRVRHHAIVPCHKMVASERLRCQNDRITICDRVLEGGEHPTPFRQRVHIDLEHLPHPLRLNCDISRTHHNRERRRPSLEVISFPLRRHA